VEHRQVESLPAMGRRASGDDPAQFLRELRQLRDGAGLGQAELAARAHYPYDRIRAAEVGPTLPDLPVLSAYVRGCGGTTEEWEERWRSLTSAPTLPVLDTRPAGGSTAADAGARIGSISPAADTPDPAVILAALDRVGEGMALGAPAPLPTRTGVSTIEPRPVAPPVTVKPTAAKATAPKVVAWETTTMRTAWSSTSGPLPRENSRLADPTGTPSSSSATPSAGATAPAVTSQSASGFPAASTRTVEPGRGATAGATVTDGAAGATALGGQAAPAAAKTTSSSSSPAAHAASGVTSWKPRPLSRTTLAALVAIVVCLLVALLAVVV
jgi:hypothetical protein